MKTTAYILSRVLSESIFETPLNLLSDRKPSLNNFRVGAYPVEVKIYYAQINLKADPRSTSCYCVGYLDKSKGCRTHCPSRYTRIVDFIKAKFFKNGDYSGSSKIWDIISEGERLAVV